MYCGTCRHYLARELGLLKERNLKHGCKGCRNQDKNCAWVKKGCSQLRKKQIDFCFECKDYPCENLLKLHKRHLEDDNLSFLDNLSRIKEIGAEQWLCEQEVKWKCPECGGHLCVIDKECYDCGYKME